MKITTRHSPFIKQFSGPGESEIICFKFWQAVVASGCPGECAYCFLQTQTPYRSGLYDLKGTLFDNLKDLEREARQWLLDNRSAGLIVGENQDGLAFERPYKRLLGITPLEILLPLFARNNPGSNTLVILSKFTSTEYAEAQGPNKHTVMSWSLSLPTIARKYEKSVSPLRERLKTARRLKDSGWRIRFRLDAMAPIPGWSEELNRMIEEINLLEPEMLTIGALRATSTATLRKAASRNNRDDSIFDFLSSKDPSGFKHRVNEGFHTEIFQQVHQTLSSRITLGLCKEDVSVWRSLGLPWNGCHCLHGPLDSVVVERTSPDSVGKLLSSGDSGQ